MAETTTLTPSTQTRPRPQVLITERFALNSQIQLQKNSHLDVIVDSQWHQRTATELSAIEALIIRSQTIINEETLKKFSNLKFIVSGTAGFDHIDLNACRNHNIVVSHCPSAHSASAAELTWGLVIACSRRLHESRKAIQKGDWDRQKLLGQELNGKTYGIIGLGRIGQRVAQIAQAFQMKLMAHDPYQEDEVFQNFNIPRSSLEELLTSSDVISVHTPLTRETRHLLGELFLESLQPHTILVNTARGPIIHEKALISALRSQKIGAVGLDVFEYEPLMKDSQLLKFDNVVVTPHIGATTREAFDKASQECAEKVLLFFSNGPVPDLLPPNAPWCHL